MKREGLTYLHASYFSLQEDFMDVFHRNSLLFYPIQTRLISFMSVNP